MSDRHKDSEPSFLETPQQDVQTLLFSEGQMDTDLQFALDRSCTPHCVEAIAELNGVHIPHLDRFDEYVGFLRTHGAHETNGSNNAEIYNVNDGWYNTAIADLLRFNHYTVVSQNLLYDQEHTDTAQAMKTGRTRTAEEETLLMRLAEFGGERSPKWLGAIAETLKSGGYAIVSVRIPSSKVVGMWGQHSVVVTGVDESGVQYFDPDKLAFDRYGEKANEQQIERADNRLLMYKQTSDAFLERMTGEVMHIWLSSQMSVAD